MTDQPTDPEGSPRKKARDLDPVELLKLGLGSHRGEEPPEFVVTTAGSVEASPAPAPELVAPHFPQLEILEVIGQGGMGVV